MNNVEIMNPTEYCTIICIGLGAKVTRGLETRLEESEFGCGLIKLETAEETIIEVLERSILADRVVVVAREVRHLLFATSCLYLIN